MSLCHFILLYICMQGVDTDEVKSVSVMEGDSVTLHTDITQILTYDQILWSFGPQNARIAEIYKQNPPKFDDNKSFRDGLKMDTHTGSLTITNVSIAHTGDYKLTIIKSKGTSNRTFRVSVYGRLQSCGFTDAVIRLVISALVGVATVAVLVDHFRSIRRGEENRRAQESQSFNDCSYSVIEV